nr:TIGR03617 family F420-dependent LLM class oxidoreductase [Rhodococcus wratislaviensis]
MPLADVAPFAARMEALGYDGVHAVETIHDSLMVAALALSASSSLTVRTAVTVAFTRSPMLMAYQAWDLAQMSSGRFELGLGSQVRANIVDRFSMPWGEPVRRMREYVESMRAIFHAFQTGDPLQFEGDYYRFTRLQSVFNPGPIEHPDIPLWVGGVGAKMLTMAGEVADGVVTHPTNTTPEFIHELCLPALTNGAEKAGRSVKDLGIIASCRIITGSSAAEIDAVRETHRQRLAFVLSTPAYAWTLERQGLGEVQRRLQDLTREGRWNDMADVVDSRVLEAVTLEATYEELPDRLGAWLGDQVSGCVVPPPIDPADDKKFAEVLGRIKMLPAAALTGPRIQQARP